MSKTWSRDKPFERINSPSAKGQPELDGDGHARGTRRPEDFPSRSILDKIARSELIRTVPSWVPTLGKTEAEAEHEVFGVLRRSFQTWTDTPPMQWHRWYDWNFHVEPDAPYAWTRSAGNEAAHEGISVKEHLGIPILGPVIDFFRSAIKGTVFGPSQMVTRGHTIECEWDTGAFGAAPGPMMNGPDWCWPMAGEYVWCAGRSIYDGGHETEKKLARSELHPVKAIAAARWEAHCFPENGHFTPAIQLMFFSSTIGGYVDIESLVPKDARVYEFIVDLPPMPDAEMPLTVSVGHTPEFPHNTVVMRRVEDPLVDFDFDRFGNAAGKGPRNNIDPKYKPKVELQKPVDREKPQVKVTIPMADFAEGCPDMKYYGVLISIGWLDPGKTQGKKVKKCSFNFNKLKKGNIDHDTFAEEWRFRAGVNGRWYEWSWNKMRNGAVKDIKRSDDVVIWLADEDKLKVASHGAELDLVDDVYFKGNRTIYISDAEVAWEDRPPVLAAIGGFLAGAGMMALLGPGLGTFLLSVLAMQSDPIGTIGEIITGRIPGHPADWKRDMDVREPMTVPDKNGALCYPVQRIVARKAFTMMWTTFNDQNAPLGIIDPVPELLSPLEGTYNPLEMKGRNDPTAKDYKLTGVYTWEKGDSGELVERPHVDPTPSDWKDYELTYTVKVEPQFPGSS